MAKTDTQQALYRFYGDDGQLLYVGLTGNVGKRIEQHSGTKAWWPGVRGISVEWYDTREEVAAAERRAIRVEKPVYNIQRPKLAPLTATPTSAPAVRRCGHCMGCVDGGPCYLYAEREADEEDPRPCPHCSKPDCLYALGHDEGGIAGWDAALAMFKRSGGA